MGGVLCFEGRRQTRGQYQLPTSLSFHTWAPGFRLLPGALRMEGPNEASGKLAGQTTPHAEVPLPLPLPGQSLLLFCQQSGALFPVGWLTWRSRILHLGCAVFRAQRDQV